MQLNRTDSNLFGRNISCRLSIDLFIGAAAKNVYDRKSTSRLPSLSKACFHQLDSKSHPLLSYPASFLVSWKKVKRIKYFTPGVNSGSSINQFLSHFVISVQCSQVQRSIWSIIFIVNNWHIFLQKSTNGSGKNKSCYSFAIFNSPYSYKIYDLHITKQHQNNFDFLPLHWESMYEIKTLTALWDSK